MMILGIDYGEKWCGLAGSHGSLASPLKAVPTKNIFEEVERWRPEKVIVGVSEKAMADKTRRFIAKLKSWTKAPVIETDETLTSHEAAKIKKDKQKQHAVAAALILERYLDTL